MKTALSLTLLILILPLICFAQERTELINDNFQIDVEANYPENRNPNGWLVNGTNKGFWNIVAGSQSTFGDATVSTSYFEFNPNQPYTIDDQEFNHVLYCAGSNYQAFYKDNIDPNSNPWNIDLFPPPGDHPVYADNMYAELISPTFSLADFIDLKLQFDYLIDLESGDYLRIYIEYFDGTSAANIFERNYEDTESLLGGFFSKTIELDSYINPDQYFQIKFVFESDGCLLCNPQKQGTYLDNIKLDYQNIQSKSLAFTSPKANSSFINGSSIPISWNSNFNDPVNITLKRNNGNIVGQTYNNISNNGSFDFNVPNNLEDGNDWFVEISHENDTWKSEEFSLVQAECNISGPADNLDFGDKPEGDTYTLPISVQNNGNTTITYSVDRISGNPQFSVSPSTFTLNPGGIQSCNVTFSPSSNQSYSAIFSVSSNCGQSFTFSTEGNGVSVPPSGLQVLQESQEFGDVYLGSSSEKITFLIRNNSSTGFTATVSILDDSDFYNTDDNSFDLDANGGIKLIDLRFNPSNQGVNTGRIHVSGGGYSAEAGLIGTGIEKVSAPIIIASNDNLISQNYYSGSVEITIENNQSDATTRYTIDGSAPNSSSAVYESPFLITKTSTVKAKAFKTGSYIENSEIVTQNINITGIVPSPIANVKSGTYYDDITIRFLNYSSDVQIFYTLDDSKPTASSILYSHSNGINITQTSVLKAVGIRENWVESNVFEGIYTIDKRLSVPSPNPLPLDSIFESDITVSLFAPEGGQIFYTLNGDTPDLNSSRYSDPILISPGTKLRVIQVKDGFDNSPIGEYYYLNKSALFEIQKEALTAIYNSCNGVNWNNNTNWLSELDLNEWSGVKTNEEGFVTQITLSGLEGSIPSEVENLSGLKRFQVTFVPKTEDDLDLLPDVFYQLSNIDHLEIEGYSGEIDENIGDLLNLEFLSIKGPILGDLPESIGNLLKLKSLVIWGDWTVVGSGIQSVPAEIGQLKNLEWLYLRRNTFETLPDEIGNLHNLEWFDLYTNTNLKSVPPTIWNLTKLWNLDIRDHVAMEEWSLPEEIKNLKNLYQFTIHNSNLVGSIPTSIGQMENLGFFDFYGNGLTGELPSEIGSLQNLYRISLGWNQIGGEIPQSFNQLSKLSSITLRNNNFTGSIPDFFGDYTELNRVEIFNNNFNGSLPTTLFELPNLYTLEVFNNPNLDGSIPQTVINSNIHTLKFNDTGICEPTDASYIEWKQSKNVVGSGIICVNNAPIFQNNTFSIDENSPISTSIGIVTASDPDGDNVTFSIVSGNDLGAFQIDQNSGELTVANAEPLNFETNPIFNLAVEVSDGELKDSGIITINLNDVEEEVLGTVDEHGNHVGLYPNPTQNFINIEWNNFERATVTELSGKELFTSEGRTLDLQTLNSGVYLVTLNGTKDERITFRIIKE